MSVKLLQQYFQNVAPQWANLKAKELKVESDGVVVLGNYYPEGAYRKSLQTFTQTGTLDSGVNVGDAAEGIITTVADSIPVQRAYTFVVTSNLLADGGKVTVKLIGFTGNLGDGFNGNPHVAVTDPQDGSFKVHVCNASSVAATGANGYKIYFRIINDFAL